MADLPIYLLSTTAKVLAFAAAAYAGLLCLLTTTFFQSHAVYLHAFQMTGSKDLTVPEMFGFLRGQVTPFWLQSSGGDPLFAWHVLPIELYRKHEAKLVREAPGLASNIASTTGFALLRDDPEARLVIYFHGAGGNVGSGYRVPSYKALTAGQPDRIHVLTFDYRGFGRSAGSPSEAGIIQDAISVVDWALKVAGIPPSHILIFSQSLGTAVNMAVAEHFASLPEPLSFAGHILIAPFADVPSLVTTYRIAGTVPILSPVARYPWLFDWLRSYIRDSWSTRTRIERYVRSQELNGNKYRITLLHAEDDYDIPWQHTPTLFWHAVNASRPVGMKRKELENWRKDARQDLGAAGVVTRWRSEYGLVSEHILRYGLHDVIMGNPIVTLAAMRLFEDEKA